MKSKSPLKIKSILDLFEILPENERIIVDVLRQIIIENLPKECKEKISYNVPFFYRKQGAMYNLAIYHSPWWDKGRCAVRILVWQ